MPTIRKMSTEECLKILESSNENIEKLIELLEAALKIYKGKRGTYKYSYWKVINEKKIESAISCINSLLDYYQRFDSLTPAQIELAKKKIKQGFMLI